MTIEIKNLLDEVITRLQPLSLSRVILFGSHAQGLERAESDLDLLIVLNRDDNPVTHKQKTDLYLDVSRRLRDLRKLHPMDLKQAVAKELADIFKKARTYFEKNKDILKELGEEF